VLTNLPPCRVDCLERTYEQTRGSQFLTLQGNRDMEYVRKTAKHNGLYTGRDQTFGAMQNNQTEIN
jgi:hypothetical protein